MNKKIRIQFQPSRHRRLELRDRQSPEIDKFGHFPDLQGRGDFPTDPSRRSEPTARNEGWSPFSGLTIGLLAHFKRIDPWIAQGVSALDDRIGDISTASNHWRRIDAAL